MRALGRFFLKEQFALTRLFIGAYLLHFFFSLYAQIPFLWSGVVSFELSPQITAILVLAGLMSAALFATGVATPITAVVSLFCYQIILANFLVFREVQAAYLSIALVVFILFYRGPIFLSIRRCHIDCAEFWRPALLVAIYFGFSVSGASKLFYPPWLNGTVFGDLCSIGTADPALCHYLPRGGGAYFILAVEISSFPLALFRPTRPITWSLNSLLHLGALGLLHLRPVALGVLILQFFLFDPTWFNHVSPLRKRLSRHRALRDS